MDGSARPTLLRLPDPAPSTLVARFARYASYDIELCLIVRVLIRGLLALAIPSKNQPLYSKTIYLPAYA